MIISVDSFFKILNFTVYVALATYLIKRFVVGSVQLSIAHEKQDLQILKEQHLKLRQTCQNIEAQIEQDQKAFTILQSKFKIWNQKEDQIALQEKAKCAQRQKNIEAANLKKIDYLQRRKCIEIEVPSLLEAVSEKLQQKFSQNKNLSKEYQLKVLQALEKLQ